MEYGFPWFEFIGLTLTVAGMVAGVWYRLHSQIVKDRETAAKDIADVKQQNALQFGAAAAVLADFKLEVARNYATNATMREVEGRIVTEIHRLGERFEKFIDNRS